MKHRIVEIERQLKEEKIEKEKGIKIYEGHIPILVSAPHSVEQLRKGKLKYGEWTTAPLVEFIHEATGCYGAFKTINRKDDANYDAKNYYKEQLIELIKEKNIELVIDLHIMAPYREYQVDMGTGNGQNIFGREDIVALIKENFQIRGIEHIAVDYIFCAQYDHTVSATVARRCHIPAVQMEMNWRLLDYASEENRLDEVIEAISSAIIQIKAII